ncbi:MAG: PhoH family protein [Betaproteobacteria bacterium]|nr:PhoH family protein [Betaproteobacteria bacterium]
MHLTLSPVDNHRLANLCGVLEENLHQLANALNVTITRHSEHFKVDGTQTAMRQTITLLKRFYQQAEHKPISVEDIQLALVDIAYPENDDAAVILHTRRSDLRGRTPRQNTYLTQIQSHDITFGIGPAGTGKTYLAVASAVDALERDVVKRLILTRPAVEAGERLGFLPGDLAQKIDPYLRPLYDALYDLMGAEKMARLFESGIIEIAPLAYMRGRTLNQAFIILDEAQNTTSEQMKMFLTRIGFGSRAVITGDMTQVDLAKGIKNGLLDASEVLRDVRGIAFSWFQKEDVMRHPLVARIVHAYEQRDQEKAN